MKKDTHYKTKFPWSMVYMCFQLQSWQSNRNYAIIFSFILIFLPS